MKALANGVAAFTALLAWFVFVAFLLNLPSIRTSRFPNWPILRQLRAVGEAITGAFVGATGMHLGVFGIDLVPIFLIVLLLVVGGAGLWRGVRRVG